MHSMSCLHFDLTVFLVNWEKMLVDVAVTEGVRATDWRFGSNRVGVFGGRMGWEWEINTGAELCQEDKIN